MPEGRIVSLDEESFLLCVKHGLWGSERNRLKDWKKDEKIIFKIDKKLSAYGEIVGEPYQDITKIWDKALYPHRIKIKIEHILSKEDRVPISGQIRDKLIKLWGNMYGWGLLNPHLIPAETTDFIIREMKKLPNIPINNINERTKYGNK